MCMRTRLAVLLSAGLLCGVVQAAPACGDDVKEAIVRQFTQAGWEKMNDEERQRFEKAVYAQYQPACAVQDGTVVSPAAFCGKTSYQGSTWYEQMTCCGYDPQRRMFACPVSIKQKGGFGAAPLAGSREYVLNCVSNGATFLPVGVDSVHLANEAFNVNPPWQFAVIAAANQNLYLTQPMSGVTRQARSILSWQFQPTDCNYRPIWGNVLEYQIRLNQ
ncbi:hypothetical protein ACUHMQ_10860 [Chitinimonas sp. PSY-7]|uniref:hypothetical protein n=1 Tax=Chitinimonas sp. PSY-7 TaxID=3459088 RepID=UPI00403FF9C9